MRYPDYLTNSSEALARQGDLSRGLACIDEAMALPEASGQRPEARGAGELIDVMASRTSGRTAVKPG